MANDPAKPVAPASDSAKPKRVIKPRIPTDHTQIKFNLHNDEAAYLQKMATDSDRETNHDMARASIRQMIRAHQSKSAAPSTTAS